MRIKLSHLIIVSLITLSLVFSAISNVSAGYSGGGAMENNTTYGSVMENNTTGGGSTEYIDTLVRPIQACYDGYKAAARQCRRFYGYLGWKIGHTPNEEFACLTRAYYIGQDCKCEAGLKSYCPDGKHYRDDLYEGNGEDPGIQKDPVKKTK